jgi:hypothetical protein
MAGGALAGDDAYLKGAPCPKCGYARTAADANPSWQCPKCLVAYAKVRPVAAVARLVAERRDLAAEARADASVYALVAANVFSAGVAIYYDMPVRMLAILYWLQSMFICLSYFVRILCLDRYTVYRGEEDFTREPGKAGANVGPAFQFLGGFVLLHLFYLVFLWNPHGGLRMGMLAFGACVLSFALTHLYSLLHNLPLDRKAAPNLNAMLFIPLARIVPMHIIVITGMAVAIDGGFQAMYGMVLLTLFKTAADVVMHVVEHHELRRDPLQP